MELSQLVEHHFLAKILVLMIGWMVFGLVSKGISWIVNDGYLPSMDFVGLLIMLILEVAWLVAWIFLFFVGVGG
mgnify:CR=1 FL=1